VEDGHDDRPLLDEERGFAITTTADWEDCILVGLTCKTRDRWMQSKCYQAFQLASDTYLVWGKSKLTLLDAILQIFHILELFKAWPSPFQRLCLGP